MSYTNDEIYRLVGRDDKVAILTLNSDSVSHEIYGDSITAVFYYNKPEREKREDNFKNNINEETFLIEKVIYLGIDLSKEKVDKLFKEGIGSSEIENILPSPWIHNNLYHSKEKRSIKKIDISINRELNGGDYDWIYGFYKKLINQDIELMNEEMDKYLAMKRFFEPEKITVEQELLMLNNEILKESIEKKYLEIKYEKGLADSIEEKRIVELSIREMNSNLETLKKFLLDIGSNFGKLYKENSELCSFLMAKTLSFKPIRLNGFHGKPIFLNWEKYLHIFIRHVNEFSINNSFADRDKFQWKSEDVITVIQKVIESVNDEVQEYWKIHPQKRFSKYGPQTLYFEGDFYTFHIESNGLLSTFHKTKPTND